MAHRGWVCAWLLPAEGILAPIEDDFELQGSELANTLGPTGLDILASLVPEACAATWPIHRRRGHWLPDLISGERFVSEVSPV